MEDDEEFNYKLNYVMFDKNNKLIHMARILVCNNDSEKTREETIINTLIAELEEEEEVYVEGAYFLIGKVKAL